VIRSQVAAIFDYEAGDEDELSFKTGELINVIDFDSPDDVVGWYYFNKISKCCFIVVSCLLFV